MLVQKFKALPEAEQNVYKEKVLLTLKGRRRSSTGQFEKKDLSLPDDAPLASLVPQGILCHRPAAKRKPCRGLHLKAKLADE
eukprot:6879835-Lingulodinium_polyedra.AAC.1